LMLLKTLLFGKKIMPCYRGDGDIFEWLEDIIDLYIWSQKDKMFEIIMDDVVRAKKLGYSSSYACDYAVNKNKAAIIEAVQNCDDEDSFWCGFSNRDIQDVGVFVRIFFAMDHDKLIQKIVNDEDLEESIQRYQGEILDHYKRAQRLIEARGAIDDPDRLKVREMDLECI